MLADKTLLSVTLAATFVSGSFVGAAVQKATGAPPAQPRDAASIYATQLAQLRDQGYGGEEIAEAHRAYEKHLKGYEYWWNQYLEANPKVFDKLDDDLERQLAAIEARHQAAKDATK